MRKNKDFESIKGFESDSNSENDSLDLYKLIMDNVDDSDDKLYQKYKLAKVKTKIAQSKKILVKSIIVKIIILMTLIELLRAGKKLKIRKCKILLF